MLDIALFLCRLTVTSPRTAGPRTGLWRARTTTSTSWAVTSCTPSNCCTTSRTGSAGPPGTLRTGHQSHSSCCCRKDRWFQTMLRRKKHLEGTPFPQHNRSRWDGWNLLVSPHCSALPGTVATVYCFMLKCSLPADEQRAPVAEQAH